MEKVEIGSKPYEKSIDFVFSKFGELSLDKYVNDIYERNVPLYFKKYLEPERRYIKDLSSELNVYFDNIKENIYSSLKNNPKETLGRSLEELLFLEKEDKEEFSNKLAESIEELVYVAEIMSAEGYRIWNIKSNIPGIGRIAKKKLKKYTGKEDLPSFEETKKEIKKLKEQAYSLLDYLGFSAEKRPPTSKIKQKYHQRMYSYGKMGDERRLLYYDLESGFESPKNNAESREEFEEEIRKEYSNLEKAVKGQTFFEFKRDKERQRKLEAIQSPYNSWWEKFIGYVFYIFGF